MSASLVLGLVTVLGVAPVQDAPVVRIDPGIFLSNAPPRGTLQRPLFTPPVFTFNVAPVPETRIICGMTVVTPQVVPPMPRQTAPEGTEFTIRSTPPPICRE